MVEKAAEQNRGLVRVGPVSKIKPELKPRYMSQQRSQEDQVLDILFFNFFK